MSALSARRRTLAAGAVLVAGALLLTGCGDDDKGDDAKTPSGGTTVSQGAQAPGAANPLFAKLPKQYQDSKVINVGSDIPYPPMEYFDKDGKTVIGLDPDLAAAIGKELGVELKFQKLGFDDLILSLQSKRIDLIMSSMSDTKERQGGLDDDGKKIGEGLDFVDYLTAGVSMVTKKGNPSNIKTLDDLCGKTVAVQKTTVSFDIATEQNEKCAAAGKPKATILDFEKDPEAFLQLKQGRSQVNLTDYPVAAYEAQTSGNGNDFEVVGEQFQAGPFGIGVRKADTQLRDVIKEALEKVIASGEYARILEKHNFAKGAIQTVTINGG